MAVTQSPEEMCNFLDHSAKPPRKLLYSLAIYINTSEIYNFFVVYSHHKGKNKIIWAGQKAH
jgi:hypothetical protein